MKYEVKVEYVPEPSFEAVEWGWEAKVYEFKPNGYVDELSARSVESKFSFDALEEAKADFDVTIKHYIEALNREDRYETRTVEA